VKGYRPEALLRARAARALTQAEVARRIGVSVATVCRWEAGRSWPRAGHLHRIEQWLKRRGR